MKKIAKCLRLFEEGVTTNKHTQVRFQSEYYVYEKSSYLSDQIEDLKYVPAPTTETPEN